MALQVEYIAIGEIKEYGKNARTHSPEQVEQLINSITEFGFTNPVLIDENNELIAGHGRTMAATRLGLDEVPAIRLTNLSADQKKALRIADNQLALNAGWDLDLLAEEVQELELDGFDIDLLGFSDEYLNELLADEGETEGAEDRYADGVAGSMAASFGVAPFSIIDTRRKEWVDRRRWWQGMIGDNGETREETLDSERAIVGSLNTASVLDAAMAEVMTAWFGKRGGVAFDPFAGDSVFGFVSAYLGMRFVGIELRQEQAQLNQERCDAYHLPATYICDTSENMDEHIADGEADFIFSCPPYADLEVYSDDPNDLSNMSHDDFFKVYERILANTYAKLKNNRFAVIVMGEVRGKDGNYIGTIPATIKIMEKAGYSYYNELILVNSAGTLPLRAGRYMKTARKVGKMHQNILVFLKGDAKQAVEDLGEISISFGNDGEGSEQ